MNNAPTFLSVDTRLLPSMGVLLRDAGFQIRSAKRADCAHCRGRSRGTVSYTPEVAYCHRCAWTANTITLARELGISVCSQSSPRNFRERSRRQRAERLLEEFEAWRNHKLRLVIDKYRRLSQRALNTRQLLRQDPDDTSALDAIAEFAHAEADLNRLLDFLSCTKASDFLEADTSLAELFCAWRMTCAGKSAT